MSVLIARSAKAFLRPAPERWLLCGGGAHNPALVAGLRERLVPAPVEITSDRGVSVDAIEAVAFAVLGCAASRGQPGNLPGATGARRPVVLGALVPPSAFS